MTVLSFGQEMLGFLSIQLADVVLLCFWFGLYGMVAAMEVMVPEAVRVSKAKKLEWDMRIVSNVHAVVLFIGGVLTYMECQKVCWRCISRLIPSVDCRLAEMVCGQKRQLFYLTC